MYLSIIHATVKTNLNYSTAAGQGQLHDTGCINLCVSFIFNKIGSLRLAE